MWGMEVGCRSVPFELKYGKAGRQKRGGARKRERAMGVDINVERGHGNYKRRWSQEENGDGATQHA